jgi:hypothetical protein
MFLNIKHLFLLKEAKMVSDKKGLSTIVVTLILIVLSLVAVGAVWLIVNPMLKSSSSSADITSKCLAVSIDAIQVNCSNGATNVMCGITLSRSGTGTDAIGGVKLIFKNSTNGISSTSVIDVSGNIEALVTKRVNSVDTLVSITNRVSAVTVTPYFEDSSGNEKLCSQQSTFNF